MRVELLGPIAVLADDAGPVEVPGARLKMLLARLALEAGRPVHADTLADDLWGEQAPSGTGAALQALVSRLRRVLGGAAAVELAAGGYRLAVDAADVDAHRFEELAGQGRRELAAGRPGEAAAVLGEALGLWRGPALADVLDAQFARNAATRLQELRAGAIEDRFEAELQLGRHAEVLADLGAAAAERPLSERLAALRMRALSAAGRQSDALAVFEEMRQRLGDELGVDPSPELREVHLGLLRGELERPAARPAPAAPSRLPASVSTFVGREEELGTLARLMAGSRLVTFLSGISGAVVAYVVFFLLGFVALAALWSVAGALASRQEDLQSTTLPGQMLLFLPYFIGAFGSDEVRTVVSMLPIVSTMIMPGRMAEGDVPWWQIGVAVAVTVAAMVLFVRLGARLYERTLLRTGGKIGWREAMKIDA